MSRTIRRWLARDDADRGAGGVEYVGAIALAVAVISSLIMVATPVGGTVASRICAAIGTTCGDSGTDQAEGIEPEDFTPDQPCVVSSTTTAADGTVTVLFVDLGGAGEMSVSEMSDGTWTVDIDSSLHAGASLSAGEFYADIGIGDEIRTTTGAGAYANAALSAGGGFGYTFDTEAEALEFASWVEAQAIRSGIISGASAVSPPLGMFAGGAYLAGDLWNYVTGNTYTPPSPDVVRFESGLVAGGYAAAGATTSGAVAAVSSENMLGMEVDLDTGAITSYVRVGVSGEGAVSAGLVTPVDGSAGVEIVAAVTVNSDGSLSQIQLTGAATAEGSVGLGDIFGISIPGQEQGSTGGQVDVTLTVTDENRAEVLAALAEIGIGGLGPGMPVPAVPGGMALAYLTREAMQQPGGVTVQEIATNRDTLLQVAVAGKIPGFGGLAIDVGASTTTADVENAWYWTPDGWQRWTTCAG
ncbi:MAG: hypothetical protein ACTMIR_11085 [Cellulomonadaceae bacterium]